MRRDGFTLGLKGAVRGRRCDRRRHGGGIGASNVFIRRKQICEFEQQGDLGKDICRVYVLPPLWFVDGMLRAARMQSKQIVHPSLASFVPPAAC